jgi:hypothetical protein
MGIDVANTSTTQVLDWKTLVSSKYFITDLGENIFSPNDPTKSLPRYAAWQPVKTNGKHQLVETSHNLQYLQEKYKVTSDLVFLAADNQTKTTQG